MYVSVDLFACVVLLSVSLSCSKLVVFSLFSAGGSFVDFFANLMNLYSLLHLMFLDRIC